MCRTAPDYLSAADAFVLTSREDPLPSVVMEAMATGLSCVAFAGSGGIPELIEQHGGGALAPLGDVQGLAGQAMALAARTHALTTSARAAVGRRAAGRFDFKAYVASLMSLAQPELPRISVVVPSYNYARYMKQRMASILAQTQPVLEVIVLDDASTDDSVEVARGAAAEWNRDVRVVASPRNSGSVFRQWHRAAAEAQGDWIWIAEADDAAEPVMLERLVQAMQRAEAIGRGVTMVFCDSQSIDEDGTLTSNSYKPYFATTAGSILDQDGLHEGADFVRDCLSERNLILNASGVLFSRDALRQALAGCGEELFAFRMAGDWRLYIEIAARAGCQGRLCRCTAQHPPPGTASPPPTGSPARSIWARSRASTALSDAARACWMPTGHASAPTATSSRASSGSGSLGSSGSYSANSRQPAEAVVPPACRRSVCLVL